MTARQFRAESGRMPKGPDLNALPRALEKITDFWMQARKLI
jgi:hypothetical protein